MTLDEILEQVKTLSVAERKALLKEVIDLWDNPKDDYVIRVMRREELALAVELARAEGWNPGIYDLDCFYETDPNGFLIGLLNGEPISTISVVRYPNDYAFLGFYIVKPEFRGRGYGYKLWQAGMQYLEGCDVGLDGVIAQIDNYARSGFQLAYSNARYRGEAVGGCDYNDDRIVKLADIPFDALVQYDESVFGAPRARFLQLWISRPETLAIGIREAEKLAGYAVLRKCFEGYKVGPLFADSMALADSLFQMLHVTMPKGTPLFLDIPEEAQNRDATALVSKYNMVKVFDTARMYRMREPGREMALPLQKWFGVTTFELG